MRRPLRIIRASRGKIRVYKSAAHALALLATACTCGGDPSTDDASVHPWPDIVETSDTGEVPDPATLGAAIYTYVALSDLRYGNGRVILDALDLGLEIREMCRRL